MQKMLAASELRYRRLFESAQDGILILNAETGMIVDVNLFLVKLLGTPHAAFLGKQLWELGFFKDRVANQAHFAELQAKGYIRYEDRPLETSDGRRVAVEFVSNVYGENGSKVIQCNIRDITARKQAEALLREKEYLLSESQRLGHVGSWFYDMHGPFKWSAELYRLYGVSPATFIPTAESLLSLIHPDDRSAMQAWLTNCAAGDKHELVFRINRPDGALRFVLGRGEAFYDAGHCLTHMAGTALDITERELAVAEMRLQGSALGAAANAIMITDTDGNLVWANPAFTRLTGYAVAEVLGQNPRVLKSGQHPAAFYPRLWETITAGKVWSGELVNKRKDGSLYTEEMTITPVRSERGKITNFIAIKQDITERKRSEQQLVDSNRQLGTALAELRQSQQQVIQQENLRTLGQMASGIAHDFNNALAPIIGFCELLQKFPEKLANRELANRYLKNISTAANDAAGIVRRLREFGRKRAAGDISQAIDLPGLVRQTIELTQPRWKDQAQAAGLTIHIATDLRKVPPIVGEEYAIREVLTNLIFNAVDALPAGGTITVGTAANEDNVSLWVSDTGTGMTEEVRQHCLEPFFTTKGTKGTGLGLSMMHGIVQRHGGTVAITSQVGHGTTFTLSLPIQQSKPAETVAAEPSALERKLHLLVVDDEPMLRDLAQVYLTGDGHIVVCVATGLAALAWLKVERFDAVITDMAMPDMNGEKLAAAINQITPGVPVILMTGFGDIMKAGGEMPPHISAILSKPITQTSMRAVLAKVFPPEAQESNRALTHPFAARQWPTRAA